MKKIMFYATLVAMAFAMAMPVQAQSRKEKKAAKKAQWEMEQQQKREEAELLHKQRMDSIRRVQQERDEAAARQKDFDNIMYENQRANLESKFGLEEKLEGGIQLIITPCMDEFLELNKKPEQMAAQGIATGQPTQELAQDVANQNALHDITRRFAGVVKNATERYSKDVSTRQGNRVTEGSLEGMAMSVGEKAINKFYVVDCRKFGTDRYNNYVCYEALYVPMDKVIDAIMDEVRDVDVDKELFRRRMQAELDANAARENAALELQRKKADGE